MGVVSNLFTWARLGIVVLLVSAAIARAGSRELLVSDRLTNRILRYDLDSGTFIAELVGPTNPLSGNELSTPAAMAISPSGTLLVASANETTPNQGRIVEYDLTTGEFLGDFASGLAFPNDILVYKDQVFVSSLGTTGFNGGIVYRFNADGSLADTIGDGTDPFPLGRSGLSVGADGKLYVASFLDGRILRFDLDTGLPDGNDPSGTFGTTTAGGASYMGFDANEDLLVVGLFTNNVGKMDGQTGAALADFVPAGGGLNFPNEILPLEVDGTVLVTSLGDNPPGPSGYISKFDLGTGAVIDLDFIVGSGGLQQPTSLLVLNTLLGDLDGDGFVGQDDLNLILGSWGRHVHSGAVADLNRDGFVGQDDLNVVLGNWGEGALPTFSITAVPEPATLLWASAASVVFALSWRRLRPARKP